MRLKESLTYPLNSALQDFHLCFILIKSLLESIQSYSFMGNLWLLVFGHDSEGESYHLIIKLSWTIFIPTSFIMVKYEVIFTLSNSYIHPCAFPGICGTIRTSHRWGLLPRMEKILLLLFWVLKKDSLISKLAGCDDKMSPNYSPKVAKLQLYVNVNVQWNALQS